jgi:hypothetical protein
MTEAEIEKVAREVCAQISCDPDKIIDPYGPVKAWDIVAGQLAAMPPCNCHSSSTDIIS